VCPEVFLAPCGFEPQNDWLKSHLVFRWVRDYHGFLRQFLFEEKVYMMDPLASLFPDFKTVREHVVEGLFVRTRIGKEREGEGEGVC
jgi:hypothetical protein